MQRVWILVSVLCIIIGTVTSLEDECLTLALIHNDNEMQVKPIEGVEDVVDFYYTLKYMEDNASKIWLYRDKNNGNLSLVIHHNAKGGVLGGSVRYNLTGVPGEAYVTLSDDNGEFGLNRDVVEGNWNFGNYPDGGIISGLPTSGEWSITIYPDFTSGIDKWEYLTQGATDVESVKLDMSEPATILCKRVSESDTEVVGDSITGGGVKTQDNSTRVINIVLNSTTLHPRLRQFVY